MGRGKEALITQTSPLPLQGCSSQLTQKPSIQRADSYPSQMTGDLTLTPRSTQRPSQISLHSPRETSYIREMSLFSPSPSQGHPSKQMPNPETCSRTHPGNKCTLVTASRGGTILSLLPCQLLASLEIQC